MKKEIMFKVPETGKFEAATVEKIWVRIDGRGVFSVPAEDLDRVSVNPLNGDSVERNRIVSYNALMHFASNRDGISNGASPSTIRKFAQKAYGPPQVTPEEIATEMLNALNDSDSTAEAMGIAADYVKRYAEAAK